MLRKDRRDSDFLTTIAQIGVTTHPGGKEATKTLFEKLDLKEGDVVLDLGCGSGRTLTFVSQSYPVKIIGVELKSELAKEARQRTQFARDRVIVLKGDIERLPLRDNCVDCAFSESVLNFVNKEKALSEASRVLKREGQIALLEITFKDKKIDRINRLAREVFQVPQFEILTSEEWCQILKSFGFCVKSIQQLPYWWQGTDKEEALVEARLLIGLMMRWSLRRFLLTWRLLFALTRYSAIGLYWGVKEPVSTS
ncbi:MAG: class I SAM-dependent methyltransferase [Armatimonadetes bacterium]|nr:class I SAM-dependent methyltransferase [Armatimonadota bacterium]MDW8121037.1 methyltransferase domain-containing protein [Armatimonadota bacterium]